MPTEQSVSQAGFTSSVPVVVEAINKTPASAVKIIRFRFIAVAIYRITAADDGRKLAQTHCILPI